MSLRVVPDKDKIKLPHYSGFAANLCEEVQKNTLTAVYAASTEVTADMLNDWHIEWLTNCSIDEEITIGKFILKKLEELK